MMGKRYIIVFGPKGVGKSTYVKCMQKYHKDIQFIEVQDIWDVDRSIRHGAYKIIEIHEINLFKENKK